MWPRLHPDIYFSSPEPGGQTERNDMQRSLALLIIGLFFGGGLGFLVAASNGVTLDGHDHAHNVAGTDGQAHDHGTAVDVASGYDAPTVDLILHKDMMSGWNLEITTTNFRFSPENVNSDNVSGEGHAHVYINGEKLARIYSPWLHIGSLPAGTTTVSVSLNANDHSPLSVDGEKLTAETVVEVE